MIKLVLSDLDSTLLWQGDQHIATPFALEAIHALQDAGVSAIVEPFPSVTRY